MKFMKTLGYVENQNFLGEVVGFSLVQNTVELKDKDGDIALFDAEYVEILEEVFTRPTGEVVYDGDVFKTDDYNILVDKVSDTQLKLLLLNDFLDIVAVSDVKTIDTEAVKAFELYEPQKLGNIKELQHSVEDVFDFNVKVLKRNGQFVYACNDKHSEEIDLIKVIFIGADLLDDEEYERVTVDYDEYLEMLDENELVESTPQELREYAYNVLVKGKETPKAPIILEEYEDEEDLDFEFDEDIEEESTCDLDGSCGKDCVCGNYREEECNPLDELGEIFSKITGVPKESVDRDKEMIAQTVDMEKAQRIAQKIIKSMKDRI